MQTDSSQHAANPSLDVFDEPARHLLESHVKQMGHSPTQLTPLIYAAIEAAKKLLADGPTFTSPRILLQTITSRALIYLSGVLSQNKKWRRCSERIKSFSSIFLTGAGFSYGSDMPLSSILGDVLTFCRVKDGEWGELRKDANKCLLFKTQFKVICDRRTPSVSHNLVIDNFPKYILEIISLNWDNFFEAAARSRGKNLNKENEDRPTTNLRNLWKFHGDVENIKNDNVKGQGGWVFPDEEGYVFTSFGTYIDQTCLKDQLFTFVIVGYSENERVIYEKITALLETTPPRPTYRIGLDLKNLHDDNYIVGTSDFVLNKILPH